MTTASPLTLHAEQSAPQRRRYWHVRDGRPGMMRTTLIAGAGLLAACSGSPGTAGDEVTESDAHTEAAGPDAAAVRAALSEACPDSAARVTNAMCEPVMDAEGEYACDYEVTGGENDGNWSTIIAQDGGKWTLIDLPGHCVPGDMDAK